LEPAGAAVPLALEARRPIEHKPFASPAELANG
jgi:hypothetical protein